MIRKPEGYDEAQAYTGESMQLPAGLYVCKVVQAHEGTTEWGREQFILLYDVAEGNHADFYRKQYEAARRNGQDAKWKGVHRQYMDGASVPFFKGLITSIEKSNAGFRFPFESENNEKTLVGKKFGAVMGREEFETSDGKRRFATKIFQVRSVDGLKDAKIPEDKLLDDRQQGAKQAHEKNGGIPYLGAQDADGFMNIPDGVGDEELPFN